MKLSSEFKWEGIEKNTVHEITRDSGEVIGMVVNYSSPSTGTILKYKTLDRFPAYSESKITKRVKPNSDEFENCIITEFHSVAVNKTDKEYRLIFRVTYKSQFNIALLIHELWVAETVEDVINVFLKQDVLLYINLVIDDRI